jgi:hypothetical protein
MTQSINSDSFLKQINRLGKDIERLRRDLLQSLVTKKNAEHTKATLFGSVEGGDVNDDTIESAKKSLFRSNKDF